MKVVGYSYPWDFIDDPSAAQRAADLGLDAVAVAGQYHASRVATALHPNKKVINIPYSACYVPVDRDAWRGHRLVPKEPEWLASSNSLGDAQRALADVGLGIDAWVVLTHHDELGLSNSDLVVRNAFGDRYSYALCPRAREVREYCATLVTEILRAVKCRGVVFEACGPMGVNHGGLHDKTDAAGWSESVRELLSICFCPACSAGLTQSGIDVAELAARVRLGVDQDDASPEAALGVELADEVAKFRASSSDELRDGVIAGVRSTNPEVSITLHASARTWATGSFPSVAHAASINDVSTLVANCWDDATSEFELRSLAETSKGATLGGYVRVDRGWGDDDEVGERISRYVSAGMQETHLYHLGMLTSTSLRVARAVVEASRSCP